MSESFPSLTQTTSSTSGTADFVLDTANLSGDIAYLRTPKQAVADGDLTDGDIVTYDVVDKEQVGIALFEVGSGIYDDAANTIARTAANVVSGSNGPGVLVTMPGTGVRDVLLLDHIPRVSSRITLDDAFRIAADGKVGMGTSTPSSSLEISNLTGSVDLGLTSNNATVVNALGSDYDVDFTRTSAGIAIIDWRAIPSDGTSEGQYRFGLNSGSTGDNAIILFEPNGSTIQASFRTSNGNSYVVAQGGNFGVGTDSPVLAQFVVREGTVLNTSGADNDTQIRGLNDNDLVFCDAGNDRVGIGTGVPDVKLQVVESGTAGLAASTGAVARFQNSTIASTICGVEIVSGNTAASKLTFGDTDKPDVGIIQLDNNTGVLAINNSGGRIVLSETTNVGSSVTPLGKLHVDQGSGGGAIPVVHLNQADVSEEIWDITSTAGVGNAIEAVGTKSLVTTGFIKCTINGATVYLQFGTLIIA